MLILHAESLKGGKHVNHYSALGHRSRGVWALCCLGNHAVG
jgi:hypothetical protein